MHEHQHAPHDEFSPLDTFRILMEEKPEQAERVLRWAKSMHDAVRTVLRQQQTMVGVDQAIYPLAASLDDDTTPMQLGRMFGVLETRQRLMAGTLNDLTGALQETVGCADEQCSHSWTSFFEPPDHRHEPEPRFGGMVVVDSQGMARFFMGGLDEDGFPVGLFDEDDTPDGEAWDNGID